MFCCNREMTVLDVIKLENEDIYRDRKILIEVCSHCHKTKYTLIEYNIIQDKEVINRNKPKRIKNVSEWIEKLEAGKTTRKDFIKLGTKSGLAFRYGINKETNNKILQFSKDFNNTVTLVKEVKK